MIPNPKWDVGLGPVVWNGCYGLDWINLVQDRYCEHGNGPLGLGDFVTEAVLALQEGPRTSAFGCVFS